MPEVKPEIETFAKIKVIGVGGGGGSAVNRMIQSGIKGVDFIVANTDVQALHTNKAINKLHIGKDITRGLGAGMNPELGRRAAEESQNEIREMLSGADMVFITCGFGGGTGTGAAPIVADIARELGALTIGVVTKPFDFEGVKRKEIAEQGHEEFVSRVDSVITIPNERLFQIIDQKTSLLDAFDVVDDILKQGVQGISEIITVPGLINVDFADVRTIMSGTGSALMGVGQASGENRAAVAARAAVDSPLLDLSIDGAKGVLFTIAGGKDLCMQEIKEAAKIISDQADRDAKIIFGAIIDEKLEGQIKITVIATGFDNNFNRNYGSDLSSGYSVPIINEQKIQSEISKPQSLSQIKSTKPIETQTKNFFGKNFVSQTEYKESPINQFDKKQFSQDIILEDIPVNPDDEDLDIPAFIRRKME